MSSSFRNRVANFSGKIFPGITDPNSELNDGFVRPDLEKVSSLPLQMSLYFNIIIFPFWLLLLVFMAYIKFDCLSDIGRFVLVTVLVAVTLNECLRLYFGYYGNLQEKVPESIGFWMLSLLLQLPCQVFFLFNAVAPLYPAEIAVQSVMVMLLLVQLVVGYSALQAICNQQVTRFMMVRINLANEREATRAAECQLKKNKKT